MQVIRLAPPGVRPRRRASDHPIEAHLRPGTVEGDRRLLRAAALGDAAAWGQLVDAHAQTVYETTRRAGLAPGPAAEVCELVWLRLAQALPDLADLPVGDWLRDFSAAESAAAVRAVPVP